MLITYVIIGQFIGQLAGTVFAYILLEANSTQFQVILQNPSIHPLGRSALFLFQSVITLSSYIIAPLVFIQKYNNRNVLEIINIKHEPLHIYGLSILIVVVSMPVISVMIKINNQIVLPDFMEGFEEGARNLENRAMVIIRHLTRFENPGQFVIAIVVMAILPAIGEELVFRGLLQNQLKEITKSIHVAIWVSAFLFSAIHFQFFGLFPRLILGVVIGYMYYWSKNFTVPVLAHFIYNSFTLTLLFLYQRGIINYDLEKENTISWPLTIISLLVGSFLLYYFFKIVKYRLRQPIDQKK